VELGLAALELDDLFILAFVEEEVEEVDGGVVVFVFLLSAASPPSLKPSLLFKKLNNGLATNKLTKIKGTNKTTFIFLLKNDVISPIKIKYTIAIV